MLPLLVASTRASAQEVTRAPGELSVYDAASTAFWEGKEHYERGDFQGALQQFQRAYELTRDEDLLYNLAQTYRRLGQCSRALEHYRRYVATAQTSTTSSFAKTQVEALQSQCPDSQQLVEQPHGVTHEPSRPETPPPPADEVSGEDSRQRVTTPHPMPLAFDTRQPSGASQGLRSASLVTLVGGLGLAGVAVGLKVWNDHRYSVWQDRDRELQPFRESKVVDPTLQEQMRANNDLGRSILSTQKYEVASAVGAGVLCVSAIAFYLLGTRPVSPVSSKTGWLPSISVHSVILSRDTGALMIEGRLE